MSNETGQLGFTKDLGFEGVSPDSFTVNDLDGDGHPDLVGWDETSLYVFPLNDSQ
jgi:hypothetical protein